MIIKTWRSWDRGGGAVPDGKRRIRLDFTHYMEEAKLIKLPKFLDERGNLSFIEEDQHLPFSIHRVYWIYDVPGGEQRGGHAFKETEELIVALSGSFDVVLHDGNEEKRFHLNRSYYGVMVPKMYWRMMENFSTNSLALILASTEYDDEDYIRNFVDFKRLKGL